MTSNSNTINLLVLKMRCKCVRACVWICVDRVITGGEGIDDPFWMLRRYPWELIDWKVSNSARLDIDMRKDWLACCNSNLSQTALAPDEGRGTACVGGNSPFNTDGGNGMNEAWPDWLSAYWMARFHGRI